MQILIIAATEMEIEPARKFFFNDEQIDVEVTGIGSIATAYCLTKLISQKKYTIVIQAGLAGAFSKDLLLGEVVQICEDCMGDMGVWENNSFRNIFKMGLSKSDYFPFTAGMLQQSPNSLLDILDIKMVKAVTVNEISTREEMIGYYKNILKVDVESMEGAAFHYVCGMEQIPFIQLRAISNYGGERDKAKWEMGKSINALNKTVMDFVHKYRQRIF